MIHHRIVAVLLLLMGCLPRANAFEPETHGDISEDAATRSVMNDRQLLKDLGIDVAGIDDGNRPFPNSKGQPRTIIRLVRDGVNFEDSLSLFRPLRHFFNPRTDQGLSVPILGVQTPSPDWALNDRGDISGQEFSYRDARQYLFDALTLRSEGDRQAKFGRLFQTLGHLMHHMQDMAQPVRNDMHCDLLSCLAADIITVGLAGVYSPSGYEKYTNKLEIRQSLKFAPSDVGYDIRSTAFTGTFNSPRKFWHTEQNNPDAGKGIAEFTHQNFVSQGTNFRSNSAGFTATPGFPNPDPASADIERVAVEQLPGVSPSLRGEVWFLRTPITDNFLGTSPSGSPLTARSSTFSIFDPDLQPNQTARFGRFFSLNRFNYDDMNKHLIPRAVAFSAGMINYFFRGKIDFVVDPNPANRGGFLIKNLGPEPMKGKFALYYDDRSGDRHPVPDAGGGALVWDTTALFASASGMLNAGANLAVPGFTPPTTPAPKVLGEYMLVFSGEIGDEKPENGSVGAVVAKAITNPYSGALYLAGEDSAGQLQFFKIDKQGVSNVTGALPFGIGFVDHTVRERSYGFKQALLTTTSSGAVIHRTTGLELKTGSLGDLSNVSFVPDPLSGTLRAKLGIVWTAQSPDPAIGTFDFTLQTQDSLGRVASLLYTRRFLGAQGQAAETSGVLSLPDPTGSRFTYNDFRTGVLFLSGDGTTIYPRGNTSSRRGIRIALGATPSAALFDLPQGVGFSGTVNPPHTTTTQTGTCSIDFIANNLDGSPNHPATATSTRIRSETVNVDSNNSGTDITIEDIFNGELLSYERRFQSTQFDGVVAQTCVAAGVDWSAGGSTPQVKVNLQFSQHTQQSLLQQEDDVLPNGAFTFTTQNGTVASPISASASCGIASGPAPGIGLPSTPNGAPFLDIDYSYIGFGPCPAAAGTVFQLVDVATQKKRIYRALTDTAQDAVYSDAKEPGVLKFRGETIVMVPNVLGNFVADVSPIGEVFFATPDLSILHHEPKAGNMPVLSREMIPNGIVKLLAAIWL